MFRPNIPNWNASTLPSAEYAILVSFKYKRNPRFLTPLTKISRLQVIFDGLSNYEKNTSANSTCLFGAIMMLKAACSSNPSYVDRLITPFIRVIQRMAREHTLANQETPAATSDLLILSLDLVKNRVGVMQTDTKKAFIGSILVGLIEKTNDSKVMRSICKVNFTFLLSNIFFCQIFFI